MKKLICLTALLLLVFASCKKTEAPAPIVPVLATIATTAISAITSTAAASGGEITNDGGASITQRGICYDATANPTITKSKVVNGSGTGRFTANMTGLTAGTTYYVRAYATNSAGTAYGNEVSFKTASTLATITTTNASAITSNEATSGGNITSDGGASITERGICYDTTVNPTPANNKVVSGIGTGSFTANMTGLSAGSTYFVRAYAINSAGTAYGNETNFKTASILAAITTEAATAITATTATSGGEITNDGGASITERGICYDTSANPTTATNKVISGNGLGSFTSNMSGLVANTNYYVRAYAINSAGTAYGNEVSFKTASTFATITTITVSAITSTSAKSGGEITNDGGTSITERGICYNTSAAPTILNNKVVNGSGTGSFAADMTGLIAATTYYLRAYAKNSTGIAYGNEVTFKTTSTIATITTITVSAITSTSATSGGNITKDGGAPITERGICYSTSANPTTANNKTISGSGIGNFMANMTSLAMGTTYYVRAYATNSAGTAYGNEVSFKTSSLATIITLASPDFVTIDGTFVIQSGGNITSDGGASITERGICYSSTPNPNTTDSKVVIGSGIGSYTTSIYGAGLTAGTLYYIRAYAINSSGTSYGNEVISGVSTSVCLTQGWQDATPYNPTKAGIHPIIYYANPLLPQEWQPSPLSSVELIVCEQVTYQHVQTCFYTGGKFYTRDRRQFDLTLREAKTGNIMATKTFYGSEPDPCPPTTIFGGGSTGTINYDEINNWLKGYVVK